MRFAKAATGTRSLKPNSANTLQATLSCPLPPSIKSRSGNRRQVSALSTPSGVSESPDSTASFQRKKRRVKASRMD